MATATTATSCRINFNAINDADRGTARELLRVTESVVDSLSLDHSRSRLTARDRTSDSPFVTVQARNTKDVENLVTESCSSTASEILKRSTHASAAFGINSWVPSSSETARLVRVPVKVLREVPVLYNGMFCGKVPKTHDHVALRDEPDQLVSADESNSGDTARRKSDRKAQWNSRGHRDSHESAVNNPEFSVMPSASRLEPIGRVQQSETSEDNPVHPLMAILDNGCLTQPINSIVAEERPDDSHSSSVATSASPIEVLAQDKERSRASDFLVLLM